MHFKCQSIETEQLYIRNKYIIFNINFINMSGHECIYINMNKIEYYDPFGMKNKNMVKTFKRTPNPPPNLRIVHHINKFCS